MACSIRLCDNSLDPQTLKCAGSNSSGIPLSGFLWANPQVASILDEMEKPIKLSIVPTEDNLGQSTGEGTKMKG